MIIPIEWHIPFFDFFKELDVRRVESKKIDNREICQILFFDKNNQQVFDVEHTTGYFEVLSTLFELYKAKHLTPSPSIIEVDEF